MEVEVPRNAEAERALLGSCLINKECIEDIDGLITEADFYYEKNREIFSALLELKEKNTPIDLVTLTARLKDKKKLTASGGTEYVASLANEVPTASNAKHYCKLITECSIRRRLIEKAQNIMISAQSSSNIDDIIDRADSSIRDIVEGIVVSKESEPLSMAKLAMEFDENYDIKDDLGLSLGVKGLDEVLGGISGGELVGLTGESGAGKTALSLQIALNVALSGKKVVYVNLEMNNKDIIGRIISIMTGVNNYEIRNKTMSKEVIDTALGKLSNLNLKILSPSFMSSNEIARVAKAEQKRNGLDFLVVDYINVIADPGEKEQQQLEYSLSVLKPLARKLNIPILIPFQMNYSGLAKDTPSQQDARGSSKLGNVYGIMLSLVHAREATIDGLKAGQSQVNLWITKNRHGKSRVSIPLRFEGSSLRFLTQ